MPVYLAKRPLLVGDAIRQVGQPVPEAAEWDKIQFWIGAGYLEVVPTPEEARDRLIEAGVIPADASLEDAEAASKTLAAAAEAVPTAPEMVAPWGFKKDGTPKSRPGRKAKVS